MYRRIKVVKLNLEFKIPFMTFPRIRTTRMNGAGFSYTPDRTAATINNAKIAGIIPRSHNRDPLIPAIPLNTIAKPNHANTNPTGDSHGRKKSGIVFSRQGQKIVPKQNDDINKLAMPKNVELVATPLIFGLISPDHYRGSNGTLTALLTFPAHSQADPDVQLPHTAPRRDTAPALSSAGTPHFPDCAHPQGC